MNEWIVLGSAASVPDADHDTVYAALRIASGAVLIDCGGSPLYKLARLGFGVHDLQALLLTHRHTDHTYGTPMLMQGLWLGGRQAPLPIYGPPEALATAQALLTALGWESWDSMFPVLWQPVPLLESHLLLAVEGVQILSSPARHGSTECLALRVQHMETGRAIAYSSDTEPCSAVVRLAQGANVLIHEATGDYSGHSNPAAAGRVACEAGVDQLVLTHYPPAQATEGDAWLRQAAAVFPGRVRLAQDWDRYGL
jgi:ribonuclease Z